MFFTTTLIVADGPKKVIADFEKKDAYQKVISIVKNKQFSMTVEPMSVTELNKMLKVVFLGGQWPGFSIKVPKDWSKYEVLKMVIWSKTTTSLNIRIDDDNSKGHITRFNKVVKLSAGRNFCQFKIKDITSKLNVKKIKALILFTSKPPKGLTLFFDDIELGETVAEKIPFIPYKDRKDLQSTLDVYTPHLKFGKNLAGGPLFAFALTSVLQGREVSELMQRLDLKTSVMHWDKSYDTNTWGMGDFYGQRGHKVEYKLMQDYLASSMGGPEKFDTMMLFTPQGWSRFPKVARNDIVRRVKEDGCGLVFVFPFVGEKGAKFPDDLREISALIDSDSDHPLSSGYVKRANSGNINGQKWVISQEHDIIKGVPIESLPFDRMSYQKYKVAAGAQVLIKSASGDPILAIKQVGKGRVATFAYRATSLTPNIKQSAEEMNVRSYRYWEVIYSLLNRTALWTAKRPFIREGEKSELKSTNKDVERVYLVNQWKNKKGEVTDWEILYTPPKQSTVTALDVVSPFSVDLGKEIKVSVKLPKTVASKMGSNAIVSMVLGEESNDVWRTLEVSDQIKKSSDSGEIVYSTVFKSNKVRQIQCTIKISIVVKGQLIADGQCATIVTPQGALWDDYEILMWNVNGIPFLRSYEDKMIKKFGATGVMETRWGSLGVRKRWTMAGLRLMVHNLSVRPLHLRDFSKIKGEYNKTGNRKSLIRKPSYADPVFLKKELALVKKNVKMLKPYFPTNYILCDEPSLTYYKFDFDFDFHPENIKLFKIKMKSKFKTIENLNAKLSLSLANFDKIYPPLTKEAKSKNTLYGLWNEWRAHNDDVMAAGYKMYKDAVQSVDPKGTISLSGTQIATPFDGFDWSKLSKHFGSMQGYGYGHQERKRLSFSGGNMLNAVPAGYGRSGKSVDYQIWSSVVNHGAGHVLFWWIAFRNPDLTFCQSAKDYMRLFKEMRSGIGKQYIQAKRKLSPVAVLYSMNSLRVNYLTGKANKSEDIVVKKLEALGLDPVFISEEDVVSGHLKKNNIKLLFLPNVSSLGVGGVEGGLSTRSSIKTFIKSGGGVINTNVASYDEFLKKVPLEKGLAEKCIAFSAFNEDPKKILKKYKVYKWVSVTNPTGKLISKLKVYTHSLAGNKNAHLVTITRPPVGFKNVLGADGVIISVPDKSGGEEMEACVVDFKSLDPKYAFNVRTGKPLVLDGSKFTFNMPSGDGFVIALLPYDIESIVGSVAKKDQWLKVKWNLKGRGEFAKQVSRIEVYDGKTIIEALSRNVVINEKGFGNVDLPLSRENLKAKLKVVIRDILTGKKIDLTVN